MGCGCSSTPFSGSKKCQCGRNAGGDCQCDSNRGGNMNMRGQNIHEKFTEHRKRFSNFVGGVKRKSPVIDTKKYNISNEEYFSYNQRYANFSPNQNFFSGGDEEPNMDF